MKRQTTLCSHVKRIVPCVQIQGQPVMGQLVPDCYVELERRILQERNGFCHLPIEFPVLGHQGLLQLIQESQLLMEEGELAHAIQVLSDTGERTCILISVSYIVLSILPGSIRNSIRKSVHVKQKKP